MVKILGKVALIAVSMVVLSGCGHSQPAPAKQSSSQKLEQLPKFKIGKTTKEDVIARLGQPNGESMNSEGEEILFYSKRHRTGKAWIPFYHGHDRVRIQMAQYTFKNNILTAVSSSSRHY